MNLNIKEIIEKGNEERIKKYPLTFFDVVNEIFETGGYYQGEQFKNGYFISLGDKDYLNNQIRLFKYNSTNIQDEGEPVLSRALFKQRYRRVYAREEIWRGTKDYLLYKED